MRTKSAHRLKGKNKIRGYLEKQKFNSKLADTRKRFSKTSQLLVCYYGLYDLNEPHNSTYLSALKKVGVHVKEIHKPPIRERDKAGKYASLSSFANIISGFVVNSLSLFFKLLKNRNIDAVIVGYPGYFDLIPAGYKF